MGHQSSQINKQMPVCRIERMSLIGQDTHHALVSVSDCLSLGLPLPICREPWPAQEGGPHQDSSCPITCLVLVLILFKWCFLSKAAQIGRTLFVFCNALSWSSFLPRPWTNLAGKQPANLASLLRTACFYATRCHNHLTLQESGIMHSIFISRQHPWQNGNVSGIQYI